MKEYETTSDNCSFCTVTSKLTMSFLQQLFINTKQIAFLSHFDIK